MKIILFFFLILFNCYIGKCQNHIDIVNSTLKCSGVYSRSLDTITNVFMNTYKGNVFTKKYNGKKSIDEIFAERLMFYNKQLKTKSFSTACESQFVTLYSLISNGKDSAQINTTIFRISFKTSTEILEIRRKLEKYPYNKFMSQSPHFFKYLIYNNSVYFISTSNWKNFELATSPFNVFLTLLRKYHNQ